jgi:hypothetical protein
MEAPLHDVVLYASTPTIIEGTTYDIPIIVHACVDVLRRTGMSIYVHPPVELANFLFQLFISRACL